MAGLSLSRASFAAGSIQLERSMQDTAARDRGQSLGEGGMLADAAGLDVGRSAK
jgi:hypothetical protein